MTGWGTDDASRALLAYLRAVILAEPIQLALLRKYGIRLADLRALRILRDLVDAPISRFAEELDVSRSTATGLVDRLEERGLVARRASTTDRRVIHVGVTPRGQLALEDQALFQESVVGQRIAALSGEHQRQLADLLERITATHRTDPVSATGRAGAER